MLMLLHDVGHITSLCQLQAEEHIEVLVPDGV